MTQEALKLAIQLRDTASGYWTENEISIIAKLIEALAQPEPLEYWNAVEGWVKIDEVREHLNSVGCGTIYKTAGEGRVPLCLAQPEQKPVAWMDADGNVSDNNDHKCFPIPLYATPPQRTEQEPVVFCMHWIDRWGCNHYADPKEPHSVNAKPLYTSPLPQRTWVGLTEQEHTDIAVECGCMSADWVFYGAAVERKVKERNT